MFQVLCYLFIVLFSQTYGRQLGTAQDVSIFISNTAITYYDGTARKIGSIEDAGFNYSNISVTIIPSTMIALSADMDANDQNGDLTSKTYFQIKESIFKALVQFTFPGTNQPVQGNVILGMRNDGFNINFYLYTVMNFRNGKITSKLEPIGIGSRPGNEYFYRLQFNGLTSNDDQVYRDNEDMEFLVKLRTSITQISTKLYNEHLLAMRPRCYYLAGGQC